MSRLLRSMPVVVLTGMRQVGKSSLLVNDPAFSEREYVTLDSPVTQAALRENPDAELTGYEQVVIDEAQKSGELFPAIKRALAVKEVPGRFLVSGSASLPLRKGAAESLAGKAVYRRMMPMTRREIAGEIERDPFLFDFIRKPRRVRNVDVKPVTVGDVTRGGMPRVALSSPEVGEAWLEGYEQTYLERDILYLSRIENIVGFKIMLRLLAARSGQVLNLNQVARDAELVHNTAKHYLGLLEELLVVHRVQPYTRSLRSGIRKSPKLFISDSGIACSLAGCGNLSDHPLKGFMFETYVFQNLAAILESHAPGWEINYWRVDETREVDFVLDTREQVVGIEVKSGEIPRRRDIKALRAFMDATPACHLCILAHNGTDIATIGEGIWAVPLDLLLK